MNYSCDECASKLTPLCGICSQIRTARGVMRRPKYFVALTRLDIPSGDIFSAPKSDLKEAIHTFLDAGAPVPLALVMTYNRLAEEG